MSWLFVAAIAWRLRGAVIASVLLTAWMAVLHELMGFELTRSVGSIQFIVVAVVAGWTFDAIREREALRLQAEEERAEAESELAAQQQSATRLQERTEIARELHDSVLQTMKLISAAADDPSEVRYLARAQERDLRRTINEYRSPYEDSFRARLLEARAAVEDSCRVHIEQVIRDDAEMNPSLGALVDAAKEAMTNAARHSQSPTIDLFAEVRSGGVQVNVRDRGIGFDPEQVGEGGLADSMINRMNEGWGPRRHQVEPRPGNRCLSIRPHGMTDNGHARIFLVEDHPLMLYGIKEYLAQRYDLVGSATEVEPAIEMILEREPDLVLLDVRIPGGGGALVVEAVKERMPEVKFVAFTVSTNADDVRRLFKAGVDGYIVKKTEGFELEEQIDIALAGGRPVSRYVANYLLKIDDVAAANSELESLTAKEREVVTLIARGFKYRETAEELDISVKTLETHMKHIFDKLGIASRHELTRIAFETGFVEPTDDGTG